MKICIITPYLPGLSSGSAVRSLYLLKNLSKNNQVTLLSGDTLNNTKEFNSYKHSVHKNTYLFSYPNFTLKDRIEKYIQNKIPYVERLKKSTFNKVMNKIPKDTDIVQIAELQSYFIIEPYLDRLPGIKVLDAHNIDYLRIKSEFDSSPFLRKIAGYPVYRNLKNYEIKAIKKVDYILACSEVDKSIFSQYTNNEKVIVIPNGVDIKAFTGSNRKVKQYTILFMGLLSYSPNQYGIRWYIENVHPKIGKQIENYKLIITGNNAPAWLIEKAAQDPNIELKGFVDNIQNVISSAHVCICPIFSGSGTRLKLLEYMAMGKAVVSTTQGAEGIDIKDKKQLLLADNPRAFTKAIRELFQNAQLRSTLQKNAKKLIHDKYNWEMIGNSLVKFYSNL